MAIPHFQKNGNLLTLKITTAVSDSTFKAICRELEQEIAKGKPVNLILTVYPYVSFNSAEDLYYDLRFIKLYAEHIGKVAVVSDQSWKETWIALFGLFGGVTIAFFPTTQIRQAVSWAMGD